MEEVYRIIPSLAIALFIVIAVLFYGAYAARILIRHDGKHHVLVGFLLLVTSFQGGMVFRVALETMSEWAYPVFLMFFTGALVQLGW